MVRDGRIAEIVAQGDGRGDRVYDLTALTVLPGYIDTHVHIGNHFDDDGLVHRNEVDPSVAHQTLYGAENAYRTLMDGGHDDPEPGLAARRRATGLDPTGASFQAPVYCRRSGR